MAFNTHQELSPARTEHGLPLLQETDLAHSMADRAMGLKTPAPETGYAM